MMDKKITEEIDRFEKMVEEYGKNKNVKEEEFKKDNQSIVDLIVKHLKNTNNGNDKDIEVAYCKWATSQYELGHYEYGKRIENNLRDIIKGVFCDENKGIKVDDHSKNKMGDIIIEKNDKEKMVIEVKSYVDDTKSPQSISALTKRRDELKDKGYEYVVFALYNLDKKIYEIGKYIKDWMYLVKYREKVNGKYEYKCIWERPEYPEYYPFNNLIQSIKNFLN